MEYLLLLSKPDSKTQKKDGVFMGTTHNSNWFKIILTICFCFSRFLIAAQAATADFGLTIERAVQVQFLTTPGKFFQLQSSPNVEPPVWTGVSPVVAGDGHPYDATFLIDNSVQTLYRVKEFDITDGLVAFYPFNGNSDDTSGSGNNGIVHGATLTTNRFGVANSAYAFNGTDNYISIPESTVFDSQDFSISLWFQAFQLPDIADNAHQAEFLISKGQNNFEIHLGSALNGATALRFLPRGVIHWDTFSETYQTNVWEHVVAVFKPSTLDLRVYVNGRTLSITGPTISFLGGDNSIPARLGMRTDGTLPFSGNLDDVRIYNRGLSTAEVKYLFNLVE